jgi:hypothetical protein
MEQLKIALSDELRERIEAAASRYGNSLAQEIRRRVEMSLDDDDAGRDDFITRALLADVLTLIRYVEDYTGVAWYEDPRAQKTLQLALDAYVNCSYDWYSKKPSPLDFDPATLAHAITRQMKKDSEIEGELYRIHEGMSGEDAKQKLLELSKLVERRRRRQPPRRQK